MLAKQHSEISVKMAEQPNHKHPEGMEAYDLGGRQCDLGALSPDQQEELNKFKVVYDKAV